ncbi:MAG TPA: U32 family peptidase [Candidatus Faecousia faecipullorum]|nr:U32 family peptidase [Candidatus Faecousia faecipullorum]
MLELLAPAGSMDALKAAVQNGANAVYLGCGSFNARQSAKNFTPQTLVEAVKYCHVRGVQVHLTLNTLVTDRECDDVTAMIRHAAQNNVDAFIVQDLGVVQLCRQIAPHIPIHGSTQMTVHSLPGVLLCAAMGLQRVVLSRELNREEISYICKNSPIEIEVFGHGALCMCYSGQCYLSAVIGGRSGNRGRCAQPCRQSYGYGRWENKYPLSLKDNCLVGYVKELEAMGVASLKLEGRMKRPEYVATVTAVYRKAIDEGIVTQSMMDALYAAFNRQGFTDGYYTGKIDKRMFGIRQDTLDDAEFLQAARQSYETGETQLVDLQFRAVVTVDGSSLTVMDPEGRTCQSIGPMPQRALRVPLTGEMLAQRVAKTGGTPYRCVQVRTRVDPGLTISAAAINAMRRDVLNQLTALRARREEKPIRNPKPVPMIRGSRGLPGLTVQVTTREQLTPNLLNTETAMLYVPMHLLMADPNMTLRLVERGRLAVVLPRVVHDPEMAKLQQDLATLRQWGVRDALVGNLGLIIPAREAGMRIHGDFGLNVFNSISMDVMKSLEIVSAVPSFEMTLPQIRDLSKAVSAELIAYGRLPLMLTENCLIRGRTGECTCQTETSVKLTDKTGADFPIIKDGDSCRSVLLNGKKLSWLDRQEDLNKLGLWALRLYFTTENSREVDRVLGDYLNPQPFDPGSCTRGLYLRGVE